MIEHHIQKAILLRLSKAKSLRFSELKPTDMESNAFMYHLKQLQAGGYLAQQADKAYRLTAAGLTYIDTLSSQTHQPRQQPKLICILALQDDDDRYLLAERLVQPTIGTWMLPSGKQHFGESPEDHARREAAQQFGHELELSRRGLFDIRIHHNDTVVTHLVAHVYRGRYTGTAPADTEKFHYAWRHVHDSLPLTPGTPQLLEMLEKGGADFFLSLDVTAD